MSKQVVFGVDPGFAACGLAVIERASAGRQWSVAEAHTERTSPTELFGKRMEAIYLAIDEYFHRALMLADASSTPQSRSTLIIAIEKQEGAFIGAGQRGTTNADALLVQQVVGMVRAYAYQYSRDFVEVGPAAAKAVLRGIPRTATKAQVERAVRAIVKNCPKRMSEHASDAIAIALAAARVR